MAISLIAHTVVSATSQSGGVTSSGINTTGANFIIVWANGDTPNAVITDSKGNSWSRLPVSPTSGGPRASYVNYCFNPVVGSGHTFSAAGDFVSLFVNAFSGVSIIRTSASSGTSVATSTIQPGSITPVVGEAIVAMVGSFSLAGTYSIDSGFTITDQNSAVSAQRYGGAVAWLTAGNTSPLNPTWTFSVASSTGATTYMVVLSSVDSGSILTDTISLSDSASFDIGLPPGTVIRSSGISSISSAATTLTLPIGTRVGDLVLIYVGSAWSTNAISISSAAGWTKFAADTSPFTWNGCGFYKEMVSGDISIGSVTVDFSGATFQNVIGIVTLVGSPVINTAAGLRAVPEGSPDSLSTGSSPAIGNTAIYFICNRGASTDTVNRGTQFQTINQTNGSGALYSETLAANGVVTALFSYSPSGAGAYDNITILGPVISADTRAVSDSLLFSDSAFISLARIFSDSILLSDSVGVTLLWDDSAFLFLLSDSINLTEAASAADFGVVPPPFIPHAFEFYGMDTPADVEILPVPKKYDQVGPVRFDKIGKIFGFRIRLIASGTTIIMPYKIYGDDSESLDHLNSPLFFDRFTVRPGLDNIYEIQLPKSVNTDICRITFGPVDDPFYRYDVLIKVHISGMRGQAKWIPIR